MPEDINDIIEAHKGLIYKQLYRFKLINEPDALSYAYEALYTAIKSYNKDMKYALSTYATVCIYNALCGYLREQKRKRQLQVVSYNELINETERIDTVEISRVAAAEDVVLENTNIKEIYKILKSLRSRYSGNTASIFDIWCEHSFKIGPTEISKMLDISQAYASTQLSRIRNDFKEKWRQYNE